VIRRVVRCGMAQNAAMPAAVERAGTGDRIRRARLGRGMTQADLAAHIGVSRSAVAQWETDRAGQVRDNLARIARALGVSVGYLVSGGDEAADAGERALLNLYRELRPEDRQLLLRTAVLLSRGGGG
jgi:transcriptional regulator with XRE-family HTH domain